MAISQKEMNLEQKTLKETLDWIDEELVSAVNANEDIKGRVAKIKKNVRGGYSDELILAMQRLETSNKRVNKFEESKITPYFARIDFKEDNYDEESFYIGKFGLNDKENLEEKVIDWRAPLADLYYSGTKGKAFYEAPVGIIEGELNLKRKFIINDGEIKEAFDEGIDEIILNNQEIEGTSLIDEYLKINLEQNSNKKLKDVVATIQKEQNDIIRAKMNIPMIVQGSAGSGKTTVALHRLAYLIYRHKKSLNGEDILVIAPNNLFLDYISEILPNLGVDKVKQVTFEDMCGNIIRNKQKINNKNDVFTQIFQEGNEDKNLLVKSIEFKGGLLFKSIFDRYIRYLEILDSSAEDIIFDNILLFPNKEIKRLYVRDLSHLPLNKRKESIKKYFLSKLKNYMPSLMERIDMEYSKRIHQIKMDMEDCEKRRNLLINIYNERDIKKNELKKNGKKIINEYFKKWLYGDVKEIYYNLFLDEELFNKITDDKIPSRFYEYLKEKVQLNIKNKTIDSEDLTGMTYLYHRIFGLDEYKQKVIVVDEAQDYSILQFYIMKQLSSSNSFTIVGDMGQGIYYFNGLKNWEDLISKIFEDNTEFISLTTSYRSTVEIIEFANKVLEKQNLNYKPASPVLRHGMEPKVIEIKNIDEFCEITNDIVIKVKKENKKRTAIICRDIYDAEIVKKALDKVSQYKWRLINSNVDSIIDDNIIIPVHLSKGLEFDCTIIYDCSENKYAEDLLSKKLLYVALTRALHMEYIFYSNKKSKLLNR